MNVRVAPSPIHGNGVFTKERIEKDQWQYAYGRVSIVLPGDPFERFSVEHDEERSFTPYAPWCCLNHSETPNCEWGDDGDEDYLVIMAVRDIEPNEELTIDYGYDPSTD